MRTVCLAFWVVSALAWPAFASPVEDMRELDSILARSEEALARGDLKAARAQYELCGDRWFAVEDGVKHQSRPAYKAIESAMGDVRFAFTEPGRPDEIRRSLGALRNANAAFLAGKFGASQEDSGGKQIAQATVPELLVILSQVSESIERKDAARAKLEFDSFQSGWPDVEGFIGTKSRDDYVLIENHITTAQAALRSTPADYQIASRSVEILKDKLRLYSASQRYTMLDAATILIREGLEALLVIVALAAFLEKSGSANRKSWIWGGSLVGVVVSILSGVLIHRLFAGFVTNSNRELVEGLTGLFAAAMLLYVSYWLHSKSSLASWQNYIKDQVTSALARGSLLSLGFLAFLAVFREGAETTLFYIGIAPAISPVDLFSGIGIGVAVLTLAAILMLFVGLRIPLRPFFLFTGLLIYYLGFKFVGSGVHALQIANVLSVNSSEHLWSIPSFGVYPTWETSVPQLMLLILLATAVLYSRMRKNTSGGTT
ncbi:MAG TPA: FTR1 family iron permease [Leptospiraceae bacterium]|nr:FTR1 family iron permease [Leptospiraceae bacterium]